MDGGDDSPAPPIPERYTPLLIGAIESALAGVGNGSFMKRNTSNRSEPSAPIVEPISDEAVVVDPATRSLHQRIRQQEILAELGKCAHYGRAGL